MKYLATLKGFHLTQQQEDLIIKQHGNLERKLKNFTPDITQLSLIIKKHDKNHFYSGTLTLLLPHKKLIVRMKGHEVNDVIHEGFEKLNRNFEVYKEKHFKGSSKHPNHDTFNDKVLDI